MALEMRPFLRRHRWLIVVVGLMLAAGTACLLGWLGFEGSHSSEPADATSTAAIGDAASALVFGLLGLFAASVFVGWLAGGGVVGSAVGTWAAAGGWGITAVVLVLTDNADSGAITLLAILTFPPTVVFLSVFWSIAALRDSRRKVAGLE